MRGNPSEEHTMPEEPLSELGTMMAMLHEGYTTAVEAGFSPDQAMQIVLVFVSSDRGGQ